MTCARQIARKERGRQDDDARARLRAGAAAPDAARRRGTRPVVDDKELAERWIEAGIGPFNTPQQAARRPLPDPRSRNYAAEAHAQIFFVNGASRLHRRQAKRAPPPPSATPRARAAIDRTCAQMLGAADGLERCVRVARSSRAPRRDRIAANQLRGGRHNPGSSGDGNQVLSKKLKNASQPRATVKELWSSLNARQIEYIDGHIVTIHTHPCYRGLGDVVIALYDF